LLFQDELNNLARPLPIGFTPHGYTAFTDHHLFELTALSLAQSFAPSLAYCSFALDVLCLFNRTLILTNPPLLSRYIDIRTGHRHLSSLLPEAAHNHHQDSLSYVLFANA